LHQPGSTYDSQTWLLAHDNLNSNLPRRTVASDVQPVYTTLLSADGRPVEGPQQLGTSLQLKYTLNGGDVYDAFRVDRVTVSNALTGNKRHAVTLVTAGCVTKDASNIKKIVQSLDQFDQASVILHFKVFKLRFTSQLVFENVIKACHNSDDCSPVDCNSTLASRRKRAITGNTNTTLPTGTHGHRFSKMSTFRNATATLTVWYPADSEIINCQKCSDDSNNEIKTTAGCISNVVFIAVAVSLIGVVVTFAAVFVACLWRWNKV
jgi:hypothetical protein